MRGELKIALLALVVGCTPHNSKTAHEANTHSLAARAPVGFRFVPQVGHSGAITSIATDGQRAVTVSDDESIKIWDLRAGALVRTISVSSSRFGGVALAGDLVISGGEDDRTILHELEQKEENARKIHAEEHFSLTIRSISTGKVTKKLPCHADTVRGVVATNDASLVASIGADGKLCMIRDGKSKTVDVPSPRAIAMSPNGSMIGVGGDDKHVRWFNANGSLAQDVALGGAVTSVAFSAKAIAAGTAEGSVRVIDASNGITMFETSASKSAVRGLAFVGDSLVVVGDDKEARVFGKNGQPDKSLGIAEEPLRAIATSGDTVAYGDAKGSLYVSIAGQRAYFKEHNPVQARHVAFGDGGRLFISGPSTLEVWDVQTMHRPKLLEEARSNKMLAAAPFGKNSRDAIVLGQDGFAVWSTDTGVSRNPVSAKVPEQASTWSSPDGGLAVVNVGAVSHLLTSANRVEMKTGPVSSVAFSPDNRLVLVGGTDGKVRIFGVDGALMQAFDLDPTMQVMSVVMSPDRRRIFAFGSSATNSIIGIWNLEQKTFRALKNVSREATAAAFTPDARHLWIGNTEGAILVWDTTMTTIARRFDAHQGEVRAIGFDANQMAATAGADGVVRLWKGDDIKSTITLVERRDDWLAFSEDGVFDSSRTGADLVAIVDGKSTVYAIDQFALRMNRPDLLLERFALGTADMRDYLKSRAAKRLAKAGISSGDASLDFAVPVAELKDIKTNAKQAVVSFACKAASGRTLKSYRLSSNNVPVVEKTISGSSTQANETIELIEGPNSIDVSCMDTQGLESFRVRRRVSYDVETKGSLHYVGFGVSKYKDSRLDLDFAHKDAQDLGSAFSRMKGPFEKVSTTLFLNDKVDANAFTQAKAALSQATVDDTAVVFVAGHGIHARDKQATYYYVVHASDPKHLAETAIPFEQLEALFNGIVARRKLLLLDTCESGDLDDFPSAGDAGSKPQGRSRSVRALVLEDHPVQEGPGTAGKRRDYLRQRDRLIYDDLTMRTGAIVLASSQGTESSLEGNGIANGYFTFALLDAFRPFNRADLDNDGWLETHELRRYVASAVSARSKGQQNPTIDRDNQWQRIHLALTP